MSDIIREFIAQNPAAGPKEIRESLRKQGHNVSTALVNRIKYMDPVGRSNSSRSELPVAPEAPASGARRGRKKRRGRRATRRPGRRPGVNGNVQISIEHLLAAKKLVDELGGIEAAQTAVAALAKLG
ncbi:MAG TPA: hypothetical protein VF306_21675 [Pirellulales bacterium]